MAFRLIAGNDPALSFEDPHEVLRAYTPDEAQAALARAEDALKSGRWVGGYLSYELGAAYMRLPVRPSSHPLLALGIFDPPRQVALPPNESAAISGLLPQIERAQYDAALASLHRAIADGYVYQVNYAIPTALATSGETFALYAECARRAGAKYSCYVEDDERTILSWSPELFLRFDGERISTKPMKGTAALDAIDELANEKNRAEHVMIVDVLRNDLHRICNDVRVDKLFTIERYATYATMTSTISGALRTGATLSDVFHATFPCASVTGAPKRSAVRYIAELEPYVRDVYCGTIGFLSPERHGWWNVAIRTAQIERETGSGRFHVGGGIVADSSSKGEWAEIRIKSRFLRDAAHGFALLETFASDATDATIALHESRLAASAAAFGIAYDASALREAIEPLRSRNKRLVRVRVSLDGAATVTQAPLEPNVAVSICIADERVRSDDPFLRHKTTWRPAHNVASQTATGRGCFDALLRNERGELTEGARTNLFVERDGMLFTPPLASGVLPGILRQQLLAEERALERRITLDDLDSADAIYIGNSARGLLLATVTERIPERLR